MFPPTITHTAIQEIPRSVLYPRDSISQNILAYVSLQKNVCSSFRCTDDFADLLQGYLVKIRARSTNVVLASASVGNANDCMELALRLWTGCGAMKDQNSAVDWWRRIIDRTYPGAPSSAPRAIQMKALSCLANVYLERSDVSESTGLIEDLFHAGRLADACASFGFVTPAVLVIARKIEVAGLRRQAECPYVGVDTTRFEKLKHLWEVSDARNAEMFAEDEKRNAKVLKAPNLYQCAAEGCGIEATKKSGLLRCSGKCPLSVKPSYCSKECQKADWKRHRVLCKADAAPKLDMPKPNTSDALPTPEPRHILSGRIGPEHLRDGGKEMCIEMPAPGLPGGKMRFTSSTMSPAFMRQVRAQAEKDIGSRGH